jgi:hypothetical protein
MDGVAHVELRGLRFEYAVAEAVSAVGVTNVTIDNCTISNSGTDGILSEFSAELEIGDIISL